MYFCWFLAVCAVSVVLKVSAISLLILLLWRVFFLSLSKSNTKKSIIVLSKTNTKKCICMPDHKHICCTWDIHFCIFFSFSKQTSVRLYVFRYFLSDLDKCMYSGKYMHVSALGLRILEYIFWEYILCSLCCVISVDCMK